VNIIPKGKYVGRAHGYKFGTSEKGTEFIAVEFSIEEGEHAGARLSWRGFFTDATQQRTIESLRYCGWAGDNITDLEGLGKNLVQLVIEPEEYNGKTYPRIQWVNRLGNLAVKNEMDAGARASFAARMKGHVLGVDKSLANGTAAPARSSGNGAAPPPSHQSDDPGFGDDDIPF
jgi:hypothetical protein